MTFAVNTPSPRPQLDDLSATPDGVQLDSIKAHLDLLLMALEAAANIGSEAMLAAAVSLELQAIVADRVGLWRLRQSNPYRKSSGGRKKLDVDEARAMVLIVCYLAREHRTNLRQAVLLLEQMTQMRQKPHRAPILGDYLDAFSHLYRERLETGDRISSQEIEQVAFKLLVDLLFYSSPQGHRRLWLALIDRGEASSPP